MSTELLESVSHHTATYQEFLDADQWPISTSTDQIGYSGSGFGSGTEFQFSLNDQQQQHLEQLYRLQFQQNYSSHLLSDSERQLYDYDDDSDVDVEGPVETFLRWFTVAAVTSGGAVNLSCLLYLLIIRRTNMRFLPQLFGVVGGNALFLALFGWNLVTLYYQRPSFTSALYCRCSLFLMGAMRQFPHVCMMAVSVEQCLVIWRSPYERIKASLHFWRHVCIVALLAVVCLSLNSWIIFIAQQQDVGCIPDPKVVDEVVFLRISVANIVILDFLPYVIISLSHIGLIYKLHNTCQMKHLNAPSNGTMSDALSRSLTVAGAQVTRGLQPSSCVTIRHQAASCVTMRYTRSDRMIRNRRRTVFQLITVITVITTLNLPNNILNIVNKFVKPSPEVSPLRHGIDLTAYLLYNFQFVIAALYVRLPLFRNRKTQNSNDPSAANGSAPSSIKRAVLMTSIATSIPPGNHGFGAVGSRSTGANVRLTPMRYSERTREQQIPMAEVYRRSLSLVPTI